MLEITPRQKRQIGSARLEMISGTKLDCAAGYKLLSAAKANEQLSLIERLLNDPIDIGIETQKTRIAKRAVRQKATAEKIKQDTLDAPEALDAILKDEVRLAALCRTLAERGEQPGPYALTARMFAVFVDRLLEAQMPPEDRLLIAQNKAELTAAGIDPDAVATDLYEPDEDIADSTWEQQALAAPSRFKDRRIDVASDVTDEEINAFMERTL